MAFASSKSSTTHHSDFNSIYLERKGNILIKRSHFNPALCDLTTACLPGDLWIKYFVQYFKL